MIVPECLGFRNMSATMRAGDHIVDLAGGAAAFAACGGEHTLDEPQDQPQANKDNNDAEYHAGLMQN